MTKPIKQDLTTLKLSPLELNLIWDALYGRRAQRSPEHYQEYTVLMAKILGKDLPNL